MDNHEFARGVTTAAASSKQIDEDPWSESEPMPWPRSVTVPSGAGPSRPDMTALSMEDSHMANLNTIQQYKIQQLEQYKQEHQKLQSTRVRSIAANIVLCCVNLLVGCFLPALADQSRTASVNRLSVDGNRKTFEEIDKRFPYNPAQLITGEALANVVIGLVAMKFVVGSPVCQLLDAARQYEMLPLTLIYCVGDIAALGAIGSGGGVLYLTVTNSRLLFAALASKMIMGQHLECFRWGLLATITTCIVIFAAGHVREDKMSDSATVALLLALLKSFLSAVAAVLTETRYKKMNIWEANTLLKSQSFVVALLLSKIRYCEPLPLCSAADLVDGQRCISFRGWDRWTCVVLLVEVSNGWLSVAILTRLSAIAKFVCKAACAPSLYLAYIFLGWNQFKLLPFASVVVMALSIVLYAKETIEFLWKYVKARRTQRNSWAGEYPRPAEPDSAVKSAKQAECKVKRHDGSVSSKRIEREAGP